MDTLDAPAQVILWPDLPGLAEGRTYPTLREALAAAVAANRSGRTPWIMTLDGDILSPGRVEILWAELRDRKGSGKGSDSCAA